MAGPALAQELREPVVTPAVQVTKTVDPARAHNQPQLLVSPKDPDTLAIVEAEFLTSTCSVHVSLDGGRTWRKAAGKPVPPGYRSCSRPAFGPYLAARFGADGTLFVVGAGSDSSGGKGPTDAYLARSNDLGETWEYSIIAKSKEREFVLQDKAKAPGMERFGYVRMAVHPTDPDRVYAGFRVQNQEGGGGAITDSAPRSWVYVSTDGGRTWNSGADIMEKTFTRDEVLGSDVPAMSVASDGTIYAFTKERPPPAPPAPAAPTTPAPAAPAPTPGPSPLPPGPATACQPLKNLAPASPAASPTAAASPSPSPSPSPRPSPGAPGAGARLLMSVSKDDGKTWEAKSIDESGVVCIPCLTTPETALDPKTGAVYVVFEQSDSPPPNARDDRNIWFMRSTDGGGTWSERKKLNDDDDPNRQPNYDQFFPGISVAPNGRVDVAWYDFRTDALYNPEGTGKTNRSNETCWDVFYTYSADGGKTWAKNLRVSDRTMNQNEGYVLHLSYDVRGPIGIASTDAVAHVGWSDSRAGHVELPAEDVYVAGVVHAAGGAEGAGGIQAPSVLMGAAGGLLLAGLVAFGVSRRAARAGPAGQAGLGGRLDH